MKKIIFIVSLFLAATAYSQESGSFRVKTDNSGVEVIEYLVDVPKQSIVLNFGYNIPFINNSLTKSDFWNKKTGAGIDFGVDYRHQFQKRAIEDEVVIRVPTMFAAGAGLGIRYLHKSIWFNNYEDVLKNYTDKDDDKCDVHLNYKNVKETASLTYLDIPLYVEVGKLDRMKPSGFFKLGFTPSILISKTLDYEGAYTASGHYSKINGETVDVIIDDKPILGYFDKEQPCYDNPEQDLSSFVLWGTISGGVNFPFSDLEKGKSANWILRISAKMDYSLTPISKELPESGFTGSAFRLNQSNMLGGDGSRVFSIGVMVGLIYCL